MTDNFREDYRGIKWLLVKDSWLALVPIGVGILLILWSLLKIFGVI